MNAIHGHFEWHAQPKRRRAALAGGLIARSDIPALSAWVFHSPHWPLVDRLNNTVTGPAYSAE